MKNLSISNIAWPAHENSEILFLMKEKKFSGLEVAPTTIWSNSPDVSKKDIATFKEHVNEYGIDVVAMQSLLYGHPEMTIFNDRDARNLTLTHLRKCIDLGAELGISAYVFGSPKNRCIPDEAGPEYQRIAFDFFDTIGDYAYDNGGVLCIEPNPVSYGTNFINSTFEALKFVKLINNPGLKINVDTGTIIENQEDFYSILRGSMDYIGHVHVSEPFLNPIDRTRSEHKGLSSLLEAEGYSQYVSIEMKKVSETACICNVQDAIDYISELYR
jgi:D-psicose/D-tagatose/L-ribulose 3-epimerase